MNWEQSRLHHAGDSHILKISKSIKLLVKKENVSFVEKAIGTFGATQYLSRGLRMGQSEPCGCRNKARATVLACSKDLPGGQSNGEKNKGDVGRAWSAKY